MKFRGYLSTFVEVEADNEGIAEKLMQEKLVNQIRRGESGLVLWERPAELPQPEGGK